MTTGKIYKHTLQRSSANPIDYDLLLDRIIEIDEKIFNHADIRAEQVDKVFRDPADNDNIACLIYRDNQPIAYCFVKIIYVTFKNRRVRAIQGAVGILPGQHGGNLVFPTYLSLCLKYLFDFRCPTYGVGFITSPNLYAASAKFARRIYPSPDYPDAHSDEAQVLNKVIDHWQVKPIEDNALPFFITEDVAAVDSFDIEPRNKEEAFFFQYNPGFKQGHYLGFCVKFTLLRMSQCLGYFLYKRFKKQRQRQSSAQETAG